MSDGEQEVKKARVETLDSPKPAVPENTIATEVYAVVKDSEDGELMELPCNPDKSLSLITLAHSFPGATGLKFKNPKTGVSRALQLDSTGAYFMCPPGGWEDKVMVAIFPPKVSEETVVHHPQSGSKGDAKRRKVASEHDSDDEASEKREKLEDTQDLIVLGLPYSATEDVIKEYFQQFGDVKMIDLKIDFNGKSKGFGFVHMETMEGQNKILDAVDHHISGRRCEVKLPDPEHGRKDPRAGKVVSNKIFIARMTDKLTADDLHNYFTEQCERVRKASNVNCEVNDVYIPKPFRGFGFVTLSHTSVAKKLCEKGSATIAGVSVAFSVAQPRNDDTFAYNSPNRYDYETSAYGYGYGSEYNRDFRGGDSWGYDPRTYGYGSYDSSFYNRSQKRPLRGTNSGFPSRGGAGFNRGGFQHVQGSHNLANGIDNLNLNRQQGGGGEWYHLQPSGHAGPSSTRN